MVVTFGMEYFADRLNREIYKEYLVIPKKRLFQYEVEHCGMKHRGISDNLIDQRILQFGKWAEHEIAFLRAVASQRGKENTFFLDIGANTGVHTVCMSGFSKRVYAIEPFPLVLARLKDNLALNQITNVDVYPVGFGATKSTIPFFPPRADNIGVGSFATDFSGTPQSANAIMLPVVSGDSLLEDKPVTLIKLDVEGFEKYALQGLSHTISSNRPIILMELNSNADGGFSSFEEILGVLPPHYSILRLETKSKDSSFALVKTTYTTTQIELVLFPDEWSFD